ncbi:TRAP transporter substrate-binding protein DctP [Marinomonas ostreistagni]|uniref:TRAP transporter substrate-binding protein DctP n=1 Tax=Marinomonas ostreistagni TaxID=359209 RepID=UPI0019500AFC|nr:TRAP transporter substrate-binding protein DctP [Marinomonas ostreistagni]MBM6551984.1 TRAP transporter substrate-binding protein DctP [Marinomonas ostreistagni]
MKKLISSSILALSVAGLSAHALADTIRVTSQLPETHPVSQNWLEFGKLVKEKTGGELSVQLFPSAQLFKDKEVPEAVGSGAIDAGSTFIGRFAGSVPAVDVIAVPFIFNDEAHIRASVAPGSDLRKAIDSKILEETNARVLWWQAYGRNVYLSNGDAIVEPSDIEGKKIRTYGKVHGWTAEALNGAPTLLSGSKQFLAYQQGAVDVGMTGASAVKSRKLFEVMDNMTLTFDSAIEFLAVINNDVYEGLSEQEQAAVMDAARVVEQQLRNRVYAEEAQTVEEMKQYMNVVELTDAQRAAWQQATQTVVDRFVKETGETGAEAVSAIRSVQ